MAVEDRLGVEGRLVVEDDLRVEVVDDLRLGLAAGLRLGAHFLAGMLIEGLLMRKHFFLGICALVWWQGRVSEFDKSEVTQQINEKTSNVYVVELDHRRALSFLF